jgi:hypothetical protein
MGDLAAVIDELAGAAVGDLPAAVLAAEIVDIDTAMARLAGEKARRVAAFDAVDGGAADGAPTTAAWLRQLCRSGERDARTEVRVATRLRHLPEVATALQTGEISWAHATLLAPILTEARDRLDPAEADGVQTSLLGLARVDTVDRLRLAVRHAWNCLDPDGALVRAERDFRRRWFSASVGGDGLVHLHGVLDAEGGALAMTALDAAMPPPDPDDLRTRSQVRADALVDLCRHVLASGSLPLVGAQRPHLIVTASIEALRLESGAGGGELSWTGPVPAEVARRIACDASVTRLLLDSDGRALDVGRTRRFVTRRQRVALAHRDGGCVWPGCNRPPQWTEVHHIQAWQDGGKTDLDNLCLLCGYHHRRVEEGGHPIVKDALGRVTVKTRRYHPRP